MKEVPLGGSLTALPDLLRHYRRPVTYLDTNALSDLARWRERGVQIEGVDQVARDLCSFASRRTIAIGQWLLSEMAGYESGEKREDFLADIALIERLQFLQVLRASGEIRRREVKAFFVRGEVDPVAATWLPSTVHDRSVWEEERRQLEVLRTEYLAGDVRAEARVEKWHPGREARAEKLRPAWESNPCGIVRRWVRGQMRQHRKDLGLPRDESLWPSPEKLLNLWCCWAYRITRDASREISMRSKTLKGSERRGSHAVDWCHYMTAAHADEFVTSDDGFLAIARAAPGPKPKILSLKEWIARVRRE